MRYLHHGCILVNSDLDVLSQALNVDPAKYKSKGVALSAAAWGIWLSIWPCILRICRR